MPKNNVRKEDMVIVISGKDSHDRKPRRILQVMRSEQRVLVEGANMIKRHTKPNPQKNQKGGIVERESPIHLSNVLLQDPDSGGPTRVGRKVLENGKTVRIAKRSGAQIDKS